METVFLVFYANILKKIVRGSNTQNMQTARTVILKMVNLISSPNPFFLDYFSKNMSLSRDKFNEKAQKPASPVASPGASAGAFILGSDSDLVVRTLLPYPTRLGTLIRPWSNTNKQKNDFYALNFSWII